MKGVPPKHRRVLGVEGCEGLDPVPRDLMDLLDALAREQEAFRINVARLHEAARFLGTTARVRPIHKPAAVVHETVQITARAGESLAEVLAADLEQLRPDGIGHLENLAQDVDQALLSIEAEQHAGGTR